MKKHSFQCPSCSSRNTLEEVMENVVTCSPVLEIGTSDTFEDTEDDEDVNLTYGPIDAIQGEVARYQCSLCGFTLSHKNGKPINTLADLVVWLENNQPNDTD